MSQKSDKTPEKDAANDSFAMTEALLNTPVGMLMRAVAADDHEMFDDALRAQPDVNAGHGAPLQLAAHCKNRLLMRYLVTAGADIAYAVEGLKEQRGAISRTRRYTDDYWRDSYTYKYKSKADEKLYKDLTAAISTLDKFANTYKSDLAQLESIRLQNETLAELRALKAEVTEAIHGRPIDKKTLPAPAALSRKTQTPGGG
ncbi:MAG: hypothetical protein GC185_04670 [Alphaproteobacteria bacterium]|nr:hypothetical protein [Alphaproteobacteria bacterium]